MIPSQSKTTLSGFVPFGYQCEVLRFINNHNYALWTPEILLSGSVGCVKEDTLIETICGSIPISDIDQSDFVLGFDHSQNRFAFQQGTDAFVKGKDYLYRVIHEHGEFQATSNHHIATCLGDYLPVSQISVGVELFSPHHDLLQKDLSGGLKYFVQGALRYQNTIASLIYHCVERIRQCDQQLQWELKSVLDDFPLQADALRSGLFFYSNRFSQKDDFQAQQLMPDRISELSDHLSKRHFFLLLENMLLDAEHLYSSSKSFEHMQLLPHHLSNLQSLVHVVHPKALIFFLHHISDVLSRYFSMYHPTGNVKSKVIAVEKNTVKEWFWDIQIPNLNNYVSNMTLHHNSAKSILLAHIAILHCIQFPGACVAIGRRSLPDLKKTLFREILEHLEESMIEGDHYDVRHNTGEIDFANGSRILSVTWGDKRYGKFRSLKLSMILIEELTENDDEFEPGFKILKARLRRIPSVTQNLLVCATNPDEPDCFWYKYFIEGADIYPSRKVFYSVTTDNFHLDPVYIQQLLQDYSLLEAERYLRGRWISISGQGIYHAYSEEVNLRKLNYEPDKTIPLRLSFDFNTADGKPQSCAVFQYRDGSFHFFGESIIDQAKWCIDNLDDLQAKGYFDGFNRFMVYGDATGRARSSNSLRSNYELIEEWFAQRRMPMTLCIAKINPPIVRRWTTVNALCQNARLETRLFVYNGCPVLNQGMKLARKKAGTSLEDDSKRYQHVTTALGYAVCFVKDYENSTNKVIQL